MVNIPTSPPAWPQKPFLETTPPSAIAVEFATLLDRLEYLQRLEARHSACPFSLKDLDELDEQWMALTRVLSPKRAPMPDRLGDHAILQALLLLHVILQANGQDEHATVSAALYDLTAANVDRVPPKVYALLQRALRDVEEGYFPTVHPASSGPETASGS